MSDSHDRSARLSLHRPALLLLVALGIGSGPAGAGGMIAYEVGTTDVGLASAGYGARAQDASTAFTNPAGMTRLEGNQYVAGGLLLWGNTKFSVGSGTSPLLGSADGGYVVGDNGWFPGGGMFMSYSLAPNVKAGFALAGNFGAPLNYDNDWAGRYYVQQTTLLGISLLPSIAWKVTDQLSLSAQLNAMYGIYKNNVAINNVNPLFGDGQLKLKDEKWGFGGNLGMLYEFSPRTRVGLTWNSQISLDFAAPARFGNLSPLVSTALDRVGLLHSTIDVGIKVPQQVMGSLFTQVNDRWAVLASLGWQEWSKFGQLQLGVEDATNPISLTTAIPFKDTWHFAGGAQYRMDDPAWTLNFGVAYDTGFQPNATVSPLMPVNWAWRFGAGADKKLSPTTSYGVYGEYLYGGTLDVNVASSAPVALGGRGNLVGSYNHTGTLFFGGYYSARF